MSHRAIIWLIGIFASGLALLGLFGGAFASWNAIWPGNGAMIFPLWVEAVCAVLFALGTAFVGMQVTAPKYQVGLLLVILLQPLSASAVGQLVGVRVPPFAWLVAIIAAWLGVVAYRFTGVGKRERLLRDIFGKNLSDESLARLRPMPDALSARTVRATVLSARHTGGDWNEVERLAAHLREHSAWVEVQAGNRLLGVWDIPLALPTPAETAVVATLGLGDGWQAGMATGEVSGECISATRQWNMSGAVFEKAGALCLANETFGSRLLLDLPTADLVRDSIVVRPVDFFVLPGADLGVEIFEPLASTARASREILAERDAFWEAVIFFRQRRFSEASSALHKSGNDPVVDYYRRRIEKLTPSI